MSPPVIYRRDVRAVIRALAPTQESVVVPVVQAYRTYLDQMSEQDREPVSQNMFSRAMSQCGQRPRTKTVDGRSVRHRVIHEKFMASEQFDTEPARLSPR